MKGVLSTRTIPRSYKEDTRGNHGNPMREAVKKRDSWKRVEKEPPFREGLSVEAEESSLL
jgi:hypothetical protein